MDHQYLENQRGEESGKTETDHPRVIRWLQNLKDSSAARNHCLNVQFFGRENCLPVGGGWESPQGLMVY